MRKLKVLIEIETENQDACIEEIVDAVGSALKVGIADAAATVERADGGDLDTAEIVASLVAGKPVIATNPRVLVVIRDGVAESFADDGVDIELFDEVKQRTLPRNARGVSSHFADLAIGARVPIGAK